MQAHETKGLGKAMHEPGFTIPEPKKTKKQSRVAMVYLAIVAIVGTILLFSSIRGCQEHRRSHLLAEKWTHAADNVPHDGAHGADSSVDAGRLIDDEVHRHEGKFGMVKRASATSSAASATGTVLVDYQVHQPVLTPEGATLDTGVSNGEAGDVQDSCQVVLMDYVFAYSYGEPFIGKSSGNIDGEVRWLLAKD